MADDAEHLVKLTSRERLRELFSTEKGRRLLLPLIASFAAILVSFVFTLQEQPSKQESMDSALHSLVSHTLQPVADSADQMDESLKRLRELIELLPNGQAKVDLFKATIPLNQRIAFLSAYSKEATKPKKQSSNWSLISTAYAETAAQSAFTIESARPYAFLLILIVLAVTFCGSIGMIFFTTRPEVLSFAIDTVKTLLGFFIGVATTFFGVTPH